MLLALAVSPWTNIMLSAWEDVYGLLGDLYITIEAASMQSMASRAGSRHSDHNERVNETGTCFLEASLLIATRMLSHGRPQTPTQHRLTTTAFGTPASPLARQRLSV